jgi:hypothetical protein
MVELLAVLGLKEAGGLVVSVLGPLIQGSLESYTQDFLKNCVGEVAGLAQQSAVQQAMGKALKGFVELVEAEFQDNGCTGAEIRDRYEMPLRQFMADGIVVSTLGQAFDPEFRGMDAGVLEQRWRDRQFPPLPAGFDWDFIAKAYGRLVKGIWRDSAELRELLKLHNQEAMRRGIDELVGIPPDFDLRKYQETLREQYGNLKLESLDTTGYAYNDLKLWRMFIPQDVRPCQEFNPKVYELPKDKLKDLIERGELDAVTLEVAQLEDYRRSYREQPIQNVLEVIGRTAGLGHRRRPVADYVVVLGDPGSGKSTLLQYVALQWAEQPIRDLRALAERPLPLLIELRKYGRDRHDQKCSSVVEYLHQGEVACRLNQQQLHEVLQAGEAIALFDGVDEVFDPHLREVVVTDIHRFTNDYPQVQVIVTSRWLGYKAQPLRDAGFEHYMLQDLTDEQVGEFVERWHDQTFPDGADKLRKRERLHRALRESRSIRQLAGNPLLLTMMAILNRNQELPRDRPELYTQASRVLLHQWDVERNLIEHRLDPVTIDYRDKQAMLRKVAYHMQSGAAGLAGNIISAGELERILTDHLRSMELDKSREMARLMIRQLRERNFILCYLGADNYAFVHRTFLEFFAAWAFVWEFKETQTLSFEELKEQTFGHHWQEESWQEVLRLIAGMIDHSFANKIIDYLVFKEDSDLSIQNLVLATNCLIEVPQHNHISSVSSRLLDSLKQKYSDLKERLARCQYTIEEMPQEFNDSRNIYSLIDLISRAYSPSPEILGWLIHEAEENGSDRISLYVIYAVQENWPKSQNLLNFFVDRAIKDSSRFVVAPMFNTSLLAVTFLAKDYPEDPVTLKIILRKLEEDVDEGTKSVLLKNIVDIRGNNQEVFDFLSNYSLNYVFHESLISSPDNSRTTSLSLLAENFHHKKETLSVFKECVLRDSFKRKGDYDLSENPRKAFLKLMLRYYPEHPETFDLLKERIQNDSDQEVRAWATEQLEELETQRKNLNYIDSVRSNSKQ